MLWHKGSWIWHGVVFTNALRSMLGRIVRHRKGSLFTARRCASTDSQLRAQPWSFAENASAFQKVDTRTTVARFNMDMAVKADNAYFPACFALAAEMKKQGVAPNLTTYNILLRSLAHGGYASATMAVLEDMISVGVHPNENSFKHIIDVDALSSRCLRSDFCVGPPNRSVSNALHCLTKDARAEDTSERDNVHTPHHPIRCRRKS